MKRRQIDLYCYEVELWEKDDYPWIEAKKLNLPRELIHKLDDVGIIELKKGQVRSDQIHRIFKALRLQRTLGINLPATAVVMELLDRMDEMQEELNVLHRELARLKRER